jgi:hypothetical protein
MAITEKLQRLGQAARKLNEGSSELNHLIASIDKVLGKLMIGMDYVHPRPLSETTMVDRDGKRVIELVFVGYFKVEGAYHLAAKTVKVLESKAQLASEAPGVVAPLLACSRVVRHGAVDLLPDLVSGLAAQVDEVVNAMERRCHTAQALLDHLESVAEEGGEPDAKPARESRSTSPRFDDGHPA